MLFFFCCCRSHGYWCCAKLWATLGWGSDTDGLGFSLSSNVPNAQHLCPHVMGERTGEESGAVLWPRAQSSEPHRVSQGKLTGQGSIGLSAISMLPFLHLTRQFVQSAEGGVWHRALSFHSFIHWLIGYLVDGLIDSFMQQTRKERLLHARRWAGSGIGSKSVGL